MRTLKFAAFAVFAVFAVLLFPAMGNAQSNTCTISLTPSTPSPQFVGDRVIWTATAANCGNGPVYQYRVATTSEASEDDDDRFERSGNSGDRWRKHLQFRIVRDFSPGNTFVWSPQQEGPYQIMVRVKDGFDATDATSAVVPATANSRVTGTEAVVTPTLNPLVAMYSAPACEDGNMQVKFRPATGTSDSPWMTTNKLPCVDGRSRNFLVAGMLANTSYEMVHVTSDEALSASLFFTTGAPPATLSFPRFTVRQAPGPESDDSQQMIYHNFAGRPAPNAVNQVATDLNGRIEWYYDPLESGLVNVGNPGILESGGTVLVLGRPNGNIATHGWNLRTVDVNGTPTPYAGNLLVVLDKNFQVVWTWDAFDHLDVHRGPILGDVCTGQPCPI